MMRITVDGIDEAIVFDSENQTVEVFNYEKHKTKHIDLDTFTNETLCESLQEFFDALYYLHNKDITKENKKS